MELRNGSPQEAGMIPERIAYARELCARWVTEGHTPALGVCVARRGVIVLHESYGVLGPEPDAPPLAYESLFGVASVTKPITAALVMQLVDDGLVGLNRPAKDYLPEISGEGTDEILVHHLLTHTSGYPFYTGIAIDEHVAKKRQRGFTLPPCPQGQHPIIHELLSLCWDAPRMAAAGEAMIYATHNYELLGEIMRRVTGRGIEELARERIFTPLGMRDSYYEVPASESHRVVQRAPDVPFGNPEDEMMMCIGGREWRETPYAGGGLFTTPRDITTFGQAILGRGRYGVARILSQAAVAAMTRDQIPGIHARLLNYEAEHASWGYGWGIASPTKWKYFDGSLQPLGTLSHPGAGGAAFWIDRAHELVGAYFEICTELTEDYEFRWNFDLFQNVITSAVDD